MTIRILNRLLFTAMALLLATSCTTPTATLDEGPRGNVLINQERPGVCRKEGESCLSQGSICCAGLVCTGLGKSSCTPGN